MAPHQRSGALPYVLPFFTFIAFLALQQWVPVPQWVRFLVPLAIILTYSRPVLKGPVVSPALSVVLGIAVFALWVGPDFLFPAWHSHWLFSNSLLGHPASTATAAQKTDRLFLLFRVLSSVVTIPILEELFWRGWLMRWLIDPDFERVPLGEYSAKAFWIVAILFASEHGSFWDVGLLTGAIYNWWMVRTKSLWACIIAHATTNACLALYVLSGDHWIYWL
jgi:CAAX prenyl protease-like protein